MLPAEPEHPLLRNLNAPQREAVTHVDGPLLILAGAGSGKTTVITRRIAWLIEEEGVRPASILAMTFTNKAAGEMAERVQRLVSVPAGQLWVSTFHSFCTRILRREGDRTPVGRDFVIFDPADQKSLIKQVLAELKLPEKQYHPKKVLEVISDFKNRCLLPQEAAEGFQDPWTRKVLDCYDLYQKGLRNNRACDFDDLLLHTERLFRDPAVQAAYADRFRYVLVDEYQDTNKAQYLLVQHLARTHHNLCVVGDEDQCLAAGTLVRMADGVERPIESVKPGDQVQSCYGSGDFRSAKVVEVARREGREQGIAITTRGGRRLVSTPEHTHFAGYRLGAAPQSYFVYMMHKRGTGYRIGTSQVYTNGQVKAEVGFVQRARQERADAIWVLSTHASENAARKEEIILSLTYQIPTLPFVARKGGAFNGLVHDQELIRQVFQARDCWLRAQRAVRRIVGGPSALPAAEPEFLKAQPDPHAVRRPPRGFHPAPDFHGRQRSAGEGHPRVAGPQGPASPGRFRQLALRDGEQGFPGPAGDGEPDQDRVRRTEPGPAGPPGGPRPQGAGFRLAAVPASRIGPLRDVGVRCRRGL